MTEATDRWGESGIETLTLDLDKIGVSVAASIPGLQHVKTTVDRDPFSDMLHARLTGYLLSEHLADDTQSDMVEFPASWWQHVKHDLEGWMGRHPRDILRPLIGKFLDRRPIQCKTVTLTVTWHRAATRPHSRIRVPDKLGPVVYQERVSSSLDWGTR